MSNDTIKRLQQERQDREAFVANLLSTVEDEERSLTEAELDNINDAKTRVKQIDSQLSPLVEWEESRSAAAEMTKRVRVAEKSRELHTQQTKAVAPLGQYRSLGSAFVNSDEFRSANGGVMSHRFTIDSSMHELRDANGLEGEPIGTSEPIGSYFLPHPARIDATSPLPQFALYDAVTKISVSTGSLEIVRYGSVDGAEVPAWVPEASSTETGQKPWTELKAEMETIVLEQVAGLVDCTRAMLQDSATIRGFIDNQLFVGIRRQVDNKIGESIEAGTYSSVQGADWNETIRRAMAQCQLNGFTPSVILAHPNDAASIDLNMLGLLGGLSALPSSFSPYNLRVITSPVLTEGTIYVGDLATAVSLFERTGIEIFVTDSDKDKFSANIFTILAEQRCQPAVIQPAALVEASVAVVGP